MNLYRYRELLWELSRCAQLPDPHRLIDSGLLQIHGCDLVLIYDERLDPNMVQIKIDLGPPPEQGRENVWKILLANNYTWAVGGVCVFSLHPQHEHVVLILQQAITLEFSGRMFADALLQAVPKAKESWASLIEAAGREPALINQRSRKEK